MTIARVDLMASVAGTIGGVTCSITITEAP